MPRLPPSTTTRTTAPLPILAALVILACARCSDAYDPAANIDGRGVECPAGVEYLSCIEAASCTEWGYPPSRTAEIDGPGAEACSRNGGTWTHGHCPISAGTQGCRNAWPTTCVTIWQAASAGPSEQRRELCERFLAGVWVTSR